MMKVARRETEDERIQWLEFELGKRILKSAKARLIDEWAKRGRIADEFADGINTINKQLRKHFSE